MAYGRKRALPRRGFTAAMRSGASLAYRGLSSLARRQMAGVAHRAVNEAMDRLSDRRLPKRSRVAPRSSVSQKQRVDSSKTLTYVSRGRGPHRFNKKKTITRISPFSRWGSVFHSENGGVVTDPDAVYVGHSTCCMNEIMQSMARAVFKQIFLQAGIKFDSWLESVDDNDRTFTFRYSYSSTDSGVTITRAVDLSGLTYSGGASAWVTDMQTAIGTDASPVFRKCELTYDISTGNVAPPVAILYLDHFVLKLRIISDLMLQNRTAGSTTAGGADLITDIANNPVAGTKYYSKGNGLIPRVQNATYTTLTADQTTGLINVAAASFNPNQSKMPPPGSYFEYCRSTGKVNIQPGDIKRSVAVTQVSYTWNKMCQKYVFPLFTPTSAIPIAFGKTCTYGVEKVLNSRVDEPSVSVGYEINLKVMCYGYQQKGNPTAPIQSVA